ncbi:hypothetical protein [Fusobacterium sp.]|uniref:hypothetical protein n=1 Tax=Fusobacterium sp. TaxID=68766 RepID=UPI00261789D4|nr:hypothetical protein [Fusobacterium sp.]
MKSFFNTFDMIIFYKIIFMFIAFNVGIKFPDWDFHLNLRHRSIITHSPLILLFFLQFYLIERSEFLRVFISSFAIAMALHFVFDIFPKGWSRGALLHIPILKLELRPFVSKSFLACFIIISLFISLYTTKIFEEYILLGLFAIIKIIRDIKKEKKLFRPLILFLVAFCLIGNLKYDFFQKELIKNSSYIIKQFDKISKKII